MDKFLETYIVPRLKHEETENLNRSIISIKTESVTNKKKSNLPTNKSQRPDGFTGEFYQIY